MPGKREIEELEEVSEVAIVPTVPAPADFALRAVTKVGESQELLAELQKFVKSYLIDGEDFGTIPGTPKPTLYKQGADKLCDVYGLSDDYEIISAIRDFESGLFDYEVKCIIRSKRYGFVVSTGMGSCSSYEGKYLWRESKRVCPDCGKPSIIKGKEEYGGGWLCWKKQDGCGAKFRDGDYSIESQTAGKVKNDDLPTLKNTILKMAKKRSKIDAVLSATRSSGIFTQDMEDIKPQEPEYTPTERQEASRNVAEKKIESMSARKPAAAPEPTSSQVRFSGVLGAIVLNEKTGGKMFKTLKGEEFFKVTIQCGDFLHTMASNDMIRVLTQCVDLQGKEVEAECEAIAGKGNNITYKVISIKQKAAKTGSITENVDELGNPLPF